MCIYDKIRTTFKREALFFYILIHQVVSRNALVYAKHC